MKNRVTWLVAAGCVSMSGPSGLAHSQPATPPASAPTSTAPQLSQADLEEILGPIALYPDTLLASTLAACVYEEDLKDAVKFVAGGGKTDQIEAKDWDPSVKAVASMPEVIKLLGDNMPWAVAVGQAYLTQGADVMAAVQSLRARAWDNGALKTTPQQTVVTEGTTIVIEPADPQVIYVPTYSPTVVYASAPPPSSGDAAAAGVIGFGLGLATGLIIANNMDCNWHGGCVGYHGDVNVNVNRNTNINVNNNTNINNRPGQGGAKWQPNQSKVSSSAASGAALNSYKGVGAGQGTASVPGRTAGSKPIAASGAAPKPKPRASETARPSAPAPRSSAPAAKPAAPAARPSAPDSKPSAPASRPSAPSSKPAAPAAKPSSSPRPSGFNPSGGGGSRGGGGGGGRRR